MSTKKKYSSQPSNKRMQSDASKAGAADAERYVASWLPLSHFSNKALTNR
jgi:hypothetical protein